MTAYEDDAERASVNDVEPSRLRRKRWAILSARAIMVVGAVTTVLGVALALESIELWSLWPVGLGIAAAALGEKLVLGLSTQLSHPAPAGSIRDETARPTRLPGQAIAGGVLGLIVGCGLFEVFRMLLREHLVISVLWTFFAGFVANEMCLAIASTSREWRDVRLKRLALRRVMNTIIFGGLILAVTYVLFSLIAAAIVMET